MTPIREKSVNVPLNPQHAISQRGHPSASSHWESNKFGDKEHHWRRLPCYHPRHPTQISTPWAGKIVFKTPKKKKKKQQFSPLCESRNKKTTGQHKYLSMGPFKLMEDDLDVKDQINQIKKRTKLIPTPTWKSYLHLVHCSWRKKLSSCLVIKDLSLCLNWMNA